MVGCSVESTSIGESAIVNPTPAGAAALLAVVEVSSDFAGGCSGTVIWPDTVLTAAHCVCTTNWVGGNVCAQDALVTFRSGPTGGERRRLRGRAIAHPGYNPAWTERNVEHDVAVIRLDGVSPAFVRPVGVASTNAPLDTQMLVAGFGRTGQDCDGASGTLNFMLDPIDAYEGDNAVFYDQNVCKGDSGGPVLDVDATRVHAIHSLNAWTLLHGWISKAVTTSAHFAWIREQTCRSSRLYACSGTEDRCVCNGGTDVLSMDPSGSVRITSVDGGKVGADRILAAVPQDWAYAGGGEFDGDGRDELLWRAGDGRLVIMSVDGKQRVTSKPDQKLAIEAIGDLDGDGSSDVIVRRNGILVLWSGGEAAREVLLGDPRAGDPARRVIGIGDFDGDEGDEFAWRHTSGLVQIGVKDAGTLDARWTLQAIGDFDGNLRADFVWRSDTGVVRIWFDGVLRSELAEDLDEPSLDNEGEPMDLKTRLVSAADVDHDGRDDLMWQDDLQTTIWFMAGAHVAGTSAFGLTGWKLVGTTRDANR
ncbi:MAG TPA: trypsin-like serine protease [Kofleriaceae bacterium]